MKGFTLIELLLVIAVIGILSAIVLVNLSAGRVKSKDASALSSLQAVFLKVSECALSGGTLLQPTSTTTGGGNICNLATTPGTWPNLSQTNYIYIRSTTYNNIVTSGTYAGKYYVSAYSDAFGGTARRHAIVCNNGYPISANLFWTGAGWNTSSRGCEQKLR